MASARTSRRSEARRIGGPETQTGGKGIIRGFVYAYVARYRNFVILSLFLMLVVALSRMAPAYILKLAIDKYIARGDFYGLSLMAFLYLSFILVEYVGIYFQVYVSQLFGQSVIRDMRLDVFTHLLNLPVPYFDKTPHGKNLQFVTSDMENINEFITSGIVTTAGDVITILGILGVMLYLNVPLTLAVVLFFLFLFPVMNFFRKRFHQAYRESRASVAEMNAFLGESLSGINVSKAFNRASAEIVMFEEKNRVYMTAYKRVIFYLSLYFPFVESVGTLSILAILWSSRPMLALGAVTFGSIAAFMEYSYKLYTPIRDLSEKYNIYQNAYSSLEKLHGLRRIEGEARVGTLVEAKGDIELRDVWLSYDDNETYALKGIDLSIREGERIGIVGLSGSGKTSLINLLLGFYRPTRGEILLGGRPLSDYTLEGLRKAFGIVSQDVFVFPRSVRENLFADPTGPFDPVVENLLRGIAADGREIAEDGLNLSEGEKQLIAIGRMVAYRPRYVILDEATSRIDRYLEEQVKDLVEKEFSSATWLVIAHRISTMEQMDRIIVIHNGELVETGSHEDLLRQKGIYRDLYDIYRRGGIL
jgi:ATP-binding cassette subfamily B protein